MWKLVLLPDVSLGGGKEEETSRETAITSVCQLNCPCHMTSISGMLITGMCINMRLVMEKKNEKYDYIQQPLFKCLCALL